MLSKNQFDVTNQAETDTAELKIRGIVGDYWDDLNATDMVNAIERITAKNIIVKMQSEGGSVIAGLAIHNALVNHAAVITVEVDSLSASIASVIAMSGRVKMPENSFMMIHNPWSHVGGESKDMKAKADMLDKMKVTISNIYSKKTGLGVEEVSDMMDVGTFMSATEAKDLGFADEIIDSVGDPQNKIGTFFNKLLKVPEIKNPKKDKEVNQMPVTLEKVKAEYPDIAKALIDEGKSLEAQRVSGIKACIIVGHEALGNALIIDGKTTPAEAALQMVTAENLLKKTTADNLLKDAVQPVVTPHVPAFTPNTPAASVEPKNLVEAKAAWDKDPKLQAEFEGNYDEFCAYVVAINKGRIYSKKGGAE